MATFIADSNADASDEDFDSTPRSSARLINATKTNLHDDRRQKGYTQVLTSDDKPTAIEPSVQTDTTKKASMSTLTSDLNKFMQGYTPHRNRVNQAYRMDRDQQRPVTRPTPAPNQGRNNPRRRRMYDPYIKCHACGRTGHAATQCDTLAMAILIRKYMRESGNADEMKQAAENWFRCNEEALKCPSSEEASQAKPLQVLHTYMDRYLKDINEIDEQIDWDYFREDEDAEETMQE